MKYIILFLLVHTVVHAEVVNFSERCKDMMSANKDIQLEVMNRYKNDCWTRLYCSNTARKQLKYLHISILHKCKFNGSYDSEEHPETYFDFGNSLHEMTEYGNSGFNSISLQGQKLYLTGYGTNQDGELISRVIQNYKIPNPDNRDREVGKKLFESKNGFYEFKENSKKDELFFYEISKCSKDAVKFPQFKFCFTKKPISY